MKEAYQTDLRQKLQQNNDEGERPSLQQRWDNVDKISSSAKDNLGYREYSVHHPPPPPLTPFLLERLSLRQIFQKAGA